MAVTGTTHTSSGQDTRYKPTLSFANIINMNVGFFGIQYSFGLQQSAVVVVGGGEILGGIPAIQQPTVRVYQLVKHAAFHRKNGRHIGMMMQAVRLHTFSHKTIGVADMRRGECRVP